MATYEITCPITNNRQIHFRYSGDTATLKLWIPETNGPLENNGQQISAKLTVHEARFFQGLISNPKRTLTYNAITQMANNGEGGQIYDNNQRYAIQLKHTTLKKLTGATLPSNIIENTRVGYPDAGYRLCDGVTVRKIEDDQEDEAPAHNGVANVDADKPTSLLDQARREAERRRMTNATPQERPVAEAGATRHAAPAPASAPADCPFTFALLHDALFGGAAFAAWARLDDGWQPAVPFAAPQGAAGLASFTRAILSDEAVAQLGFGDAALEALANGTATVDDVGACFRLLSNAAYLGFAMHSAQRFVEAHALSYPPVGLIAHAVFARDANDADAAAAARAFAEATYPQMTGKALVLLCAYALFGPRTMCDFAKQAANER